MKTRKKDQILCNSLLPNQNQRISFLCALCVLCGSLLPHCLYAEKVIQCIANFPCDADLYTHFLKSRGLDAKVVMADIKDYEGPLRKKKGFFHTLARKLDLGKTALDHVDKIVFFNIPPKIAKKYDLSRLPKEKLVLFMWEPKTVLPLMYAREIQDCFSAVYTFDDSLVDDKTCFKFYYPVMGGMTEEVVPFEEKKFCTLVASNLKSRYENELYSARKEVIRFFEESNEPEFEFYGRGWDACIHPNYRGCIPDKLAAIKNYKFTICYENTRDAPGYITEKIFDCFMAGTVPVYLGAPNIEEYIPKGCFIDRRDFSSLQQLYAFLKGMPKDEYEGYLSRIRDFLASDAAKKFTLEQLGEIFYQAVIH